MKVTPLYLWFLGQNLLLFWPSRSQDRIISADVFLFFARFSPACLGVRAFALWILVCLLNGLLIYGIYHKKKERVYPFFFSPYNTVPKLKIPIRPKKSFIIQTYSGCGICLVRACNKVEAKRKFVSQMIEVISFVPIMAQTCRESYATFFDRIICNFPTAKFDIAKTNSISRKKREVYFQQLY